MAEHDDALLDEDLASLPDINDEEYSLYNNDDDATVCLHENKSEQLRCDLKSSVEDILDLTDLDSFEEFEKNVVVELENNSLHIAKIKQENINTGSSNRDDSSDQFNDEDILPDNEGKQPEDNTSSKSSCKTVKQLEQNCQGHRIIHSNVLEYQHNNSIEKEYGSHNFDRCDLNDNYSYIQPINQFYDPSCYQPYYNFQEQTLNLGLNDSPLFNEQSMHEPYSRDCLSNHSVFFYNNNSYTNYGCYLPVTACLCHPSCQNSSFTSQALPIQQSIQMSHGHIPIMANTCQSYLVDSNRQMIYNQNNMGPKYYDSTPCDRLVYECQDQPQYVINPLYNQNHTNKQKVLVNRHFRETQAKRKDWLYDEFDKTDRFLKKIGSGKRNRSFPQSANNMDPYSYFSDIWQTKNVYESRPYSSKRSTSPEICSRTLILKNQEDRSKNDANHQQEKKRIKTCTIKASCSFIHEALHSRRKHRDFENKFEKGQKNGDHKRTKVAGNNIKSTEMRKKKINSDIKIEENIDPEMIEYYKKIEEQKLQRNRLLREKEIRRKQLAMGKIGIKEEPFSDEVV